MNPATTTNASRTCRPRGTGFFIFVPSSNVESGHGTKLARQVPEPYISSRCERNRRRWHRKCHSLSCCAFLTLTKEEIRKSDQRKENQKKLSNPRPVRVRFWWKHFSSSRGGGGEKVNLGDNVGSERTNCLPPNGGDTGGPERTTPLHSRGKRPRLGFSFFETPLKMAVPLLRRTRSCHPVVKP